MVLLFYDIEEAAMRMGLSVTGLAVGLWLVGDLFQVLSPTDHARGFEHLQGALSYLSLLAHAAFFVGAALLAAGGRSVLSGLAGASAMTWCVGWVLWNLASTALPIHPDLLAFASIALIGVELMRRLSGPARLLPLAAALLALTPFAAAVARSTGATVPAVGYFLAQVIGHAALLAALWKLRQDTVSSSIA